VGARSRDEHATVALSSARVPVCDQVLGSHLDLDGVAEGSRAGARRLFAATTTNDTDLSAQDRIELVEEMVRIAGIKLALACEDDDLARYLVIANDGDVRTVALVDSRAGDRLDPPVGSIRPQAMVRGDVDPVIRRLQEAGAIDPIYDLGDGAIELPHLWSGKSELVSALVELVPMFAALPAFVVGVGGKRYEVAPHTEGYLEWSPLYLFAPDAGPGYGEAFFDLARLALPQPRDRERVATKARAAATIAAPPMRDPSRPYTTGTVEQRRASIAAAIAAKTRDFGRLITALQDPANADTRHDQVRRDLYRYLANHDTREIAGLFLWALQEESDGLIETVTQLAWRQSRLLAALPDLFESAEARGDRRTAFRMRAALDEAGG
jgi:hypothetical protein